MAAADKRFQVFISSTFDDLQEERQEVIQALLELDCIPAGMELFQAANQDQWSLIKKVINDCDYYVVIVGGRYGSIGPDGISYTEMEYRHALEVEKPILGFVHKAPGDLLAKHVEKDANGAKLLDAFRDLVQKKPCRYWDTASDLGSKVSRSLVRLMKDEPAVGWVRGDVVTSTALTEEALRLRGRVDELERELNAARFKAPSGTAELAQGDETFGVRYSFESAGPGEIYGGQSWSAGCPMSWNAIFAAVAPSLITEAIDGRMRADLNAVIGESERPRHSADPELANKRLRDFKISDDSFNTIKVQLRALGLIALSTKPRSVKDAPHWCLTPYGDDVLVKLRAIRRSNPTVPMAAGAIAPTPKPRKSSKKGTP